MVLVDLSAMFYRNFHATGSGPDAYTRTLEHVATLTRSSDTIVVCCEGKNVVRFSYYPEYKANRPPKPPEVEEALVEIIEELATWPTISVVAVDGYEADDVIYTLARHASEPVLILSSDKDLYACVSENVKLRTANGTLVGPAECFAKFGVRPDQIPDYLALVGDVADNIPGCPNLGPGRASLLLQHFETLDALKAATSLQTRKIRGIGKTTAFSLLEWDSSLARRLTQLLEIPEIVTAIASPEKDTEPMADMTKIVTSRKSGPLKILAYGPEGVGKTRFAAFSTKPLFLCAEKGLSAPDLLDVPTFPAPESYDDCLAAIDVAKRTNHGHRTFVIDSLDWLYRLIRAEVCLQQKMTVEKFEEYGRGEKHTFDYWVRLIAALDDLQATTGMHVIAIAHSSTKLFQSPMSEADFMRYQLALSEKASDLWKQWPDFLLFMSQEIFSRKTKEQRTAKGEIGGHHIFTTKTAAFDAKSRIPLPEAIPYETENPWRAFNAAVREAVAPKPLAVAAAPELKSETAAA